MKAFIKVLRRSRDMNLQSQGTNSSPAFLIELRHIRQNKFLSMIIPPNSFWFLLSKIVVCPLFV